MTGGAPKLAADDPAFAALLSLTADEARAAEAHLRLGDLLRERGDLPAALAHYEQSLAFDLGLSRARTLADDLRARLSPAGPGAHPTVGLPRDLGPTAVRYRLLRELGRGGAGTVYLAEDVRLGRRVALKVLHPGRERTLERIFDEARLAGGLAHPGVVRILDLDPERRVVVMEHLAGGSLRQRLADGSALGAADTTQLGRALAENLAAVHGRGIVHGDLKPGNVLFRAGARLDAPVLADFGIARVGGPAVAASGAGGVAGTLAYMAPEQRLEGRLDARSDLFALGVLLYEAVAGRIPFEREALPAGPAPAAAVPAQVPEPLAAVIRALLAPRPADRPPDAATVAARLTGRPARG